MKKNYTLAMMIFTLKLVCAQHVEFLNANNIKVGIGIGGNLFSVFPDSIATYLPGDSSKFNLFEVPKGSEKKTIWTSSLWMTGLDSNFGVLHCAAQQYLNLGHDFFDGPVAAIYDSVYDYFYRRVFKVTKNTIEDHLSLNFPATLSQVNTSLLKWPAKGNPYVANTFGIQIQEHLAPFVDVDQNGVYDATQGDYPAICGDEAIFFVFNDARDYHHETQTYDVLGFEIRGLAEVFIDPTGVQDEKSSINNSIVVSYQIENKSSEGYDGLYLSLFADPDLGCFMNDRVGCDSNRNLMFVYNEGIDPDCQPTKGYGSMKISTGVKFLNHRITSFGYNIPNQFSNPFDNYDCFRFRNAMSGFWVDGSPFTYGGSGYNTTYPTKYIFPGDPNNMNEWSDFTSGLPAGDRRMFGSMGPVTFARGEIKHVDFAFISSYDSTASDRSIVDTLKRDAEVFQQFYDEQILTCRSNLIALNIPAIPEAFNIRIYPNPSHHLLYVQSETDIHQVELTDMPGKRIYSKTGNTKNYEIDIASLLPGIYLLRAGNNGRWVVRKFIVN